MLKAWEVNIVENKRLVKEIKDDCKGIFDSLDKQALGIVRNDCSELLQQINIVKQRSAYKESLQEVQAEISQLREINMDQIDRWLV
jgi:peptide subunit release factor 1 (eRF1)